MDDASCYSAEKPEEKMCCPATEQMEALFIHHPQPDTLSSKLLKLFIVKRFA